MSPSNRRQFIKAGGIFIAASGLAAAVNAFAKEEEKQNEEVSPPEDLMREHGVLKRILLIYGEAIRRIEADQDLPPELLAESAKIIRQFVEDYLYRYDFKVYPVVGASEEVVGCVATADIKAIPRSEWEQRSVADVAKPCSDADTVSPDTDALNALSKIRETGSSGLLVTERNHLLAIVSLKDVLNFLTAKLELEGRSPGGLLAH